MALTIVDPDSDTALQAEILTQRDRLLAKLGAQRTHATKLWAWYLGEQDAPVVATKYRDAYRILLDLAKTPWARLVVDTISERLHVEGFRGGSAGSEVAEDEAWATFERSQMNADERLIYTEALIVGVGYLTVAVPDGGEAVLSPESAYEVTHEPIPGNRRRVAAAIKVYPLDWTGRDWACELYRPEATYRWTLTLPGEAKADPMVFPVDIKHRKLALVWEPEETIANPTGVVPVVPFENRATILGGGVSEIEDCVPVLRRIDKLTLDKLLTSEYGAFRQKWATGLEVPTDPETGNPIEPYKSAVDRLWISEDAATKFGSFDSTDLGPYLQAIDAEIAALAAISRVPAHYLIQTSLANPPSAESLIAAESGLVAKVRDRQRRFGEAWEGAMLIAATLASTPADRVETVWADAEARNPAQVADAAVKLSQIGVPTEALWEYLGATPEDIERWRRMEAASELAGLVAGGAMDAAELAQRANAAGLFIRSGFDAEASLEAAGLEPITHTGLLPVTVREDTPPAGG